MFSVLALSTFAQDCASSVIFKSGATFQLKTYNSKSKLESIADYKVLNASSTESNLRVEVKDEKSKPIDTIEYSVTCENGNYSIDMSTMFPASALKSTGGAEVKITSDDLDLPTNETPGTKLKDGQVTMDIVGPFPMAFTIKVTNRKVEGKESITTPAGTFDCIKISFDVETKIGFKFSGKGIEWYNREVGMVKSESYNSKGKLQSYTQLEKVSK